MDNENQDVEVEKTNEEKTKTMPAKSRKKN